MSKDTMYKQCSMEKVVENGRLTHVAWIPSAYAKVGKNIGLMREDESWDDGWKVVTVGAARSFEHLDRQRDASRDFQRKLGVKNDRSKG